MRLMYKKFTAALLAFLMIFSMGGMLRPLAESNTSPAQTSQEPKVNGDDKDLPNAQAATVKDNSTNLATGNITVDETTFPDANFRQFVKDTYCNGGDTLTQDTINKTTSMDCSHKSIKGLKGIEYFTALTDLNSFDNQLTNLDVSQNTALTSLICEANKLTSLDLLHNEALTYVNCSGNQLTSLDLLLNEALTYLDCSENKLIRLYLNDKTALTHLCCNGNQLKTLDLSGDKALVHLNCQCNQLRGLDLHQVTALTSLDCWHNQLENLNLRNNTALTELECSESHLSWLDLSQNTALTRLNCSENELTGLDLSQNTALEELDCSFNELTSLDISTNNDLTSLICSNNRLTSLDISKNRSLIELYCNNNQLTSLDTSNLPRLNAAAFKGDNQNAEAVYIKDDSTYKVDFNSIVGKENISNVEINGNEWTLDKDGFAIYKGTDIPTTLDYTYKTDTRGYKLKVTLEIINYCTVTFDPNNGKDSFTQTVKQGDKTTRPSQDPTKEGYVFDGWYTTDTSPQKFDFNIPITSDIELKAHWNVLINETNFPDDNFRNFLLSKYDHTTSASGDPYFTEDQINKIDQMDCSNKNISNLTGIKYFTALTYLDCSNNNLTSLDTSGLNLYQFNGENQTLNVNWYYDELNKAYVVDMSEVLGENGDITKVNITSSDWSYFFNIHRAYYYSPKGHAPKNLSYTYATDDNGHQLEVNLHLNIK